MSILARLSVTSGLVLIALAWPRGAEARQSGAANQPTSVVCGSKAGERQTCAANTTAGVTLVKSLGTAACELGRTWGYDAKGIWVSDGCSAEFSVAAAPQELGRYSPTLGFKVADTAQGDLTIRAYSYVRYLSQRYTDPTYTDAFGNTRDIQQRQDIQLNKAQVYFFGWILSRQFRYQVYVWTSNASLGQSTQVVVAGNLTYRFNDHVTFGGGIKGLPGVRSVEGNFPYWLMVDERQIADEFFRPSYTTGIWATGAVVKGLTYDVMLGNNLSQFGIDAGQLDGKLNTVAASLVWMPTTGEFGRVPGSFGDFDWHEKVATRLAVHVTHSDETRQAQPKTDGFDNVQLRVSDGSVIFSPGLFAPDTQIDEASYQLLAVDGGVKYRGLSFDAEFYKRTLDNFAVRGTGALPFTSLHDTGFQVQASAMVVPKQIQVYAGGSKVFGQYGNPSDVHAGLTYYPWKNEVVKWNFEYIYLNRSPVGALSLPYLGRHERPGVPFVVHGLVLGEIEPRSRRTVFTRRHGGTEARRIFLVGVTARSQPPKKLRASVAPCLRVNRLVSRWV